LTQAALAEGKAIAVRLAEVIAHLEKQEPLAALGAFQGLDAQLAFVGTTLTVAARLHDQ
jgi:hypothetical protein